MSALQSRIFIAWEESERLVEGMVLPNGQVVTYWFGAQAIMIMHSMALFQRTLNELSDNSYIEWMETYD